MKRADVIARLKTKERDLRSKGVAALYLFGSYARDEARPDSDVDVFIDKVAGRPFGFEELIGSYRILEEALPGIEIGFGTREGLLKYIKEDVEREAIRVF